MPNRKIKNMNLFILFSLVIIIVIAGIYLYQKRSGKFPSEGSSLELCDFDYDRDCDNTDRDLFRSRIGVCRYDANYNPIADVDGDDCITQDDELMLFPLETGPDTYCNSDTDCWCREFIGAGFIPDERVQWSCDLEKNRCKPCFYL